MNEDVHAIIETLRRDIGATKGTFFSKTADRITVVENLRPLFVIVSAIGALAAAASRFMTDTVGNYVAVGGGVAALCGAAIVGLLDRKKLEISLEARTAFGHLDTALEGWSSSVRALEAYRTSVEGLDEKRRNRLRAIEKMIMTMEAALVSGGDDVKTANEMLKSASSHLRKAIDIGGGELFSICIMRIQGGEREKRLVRIAEDWSNPSMKERGVLSLRRGEGYSGMAWLIAAAEHRSIGDVIIENSHDPDVSARYNVPSADPELERQYVSVAAIPILIKGDNEVWGVVFATSGRPGVFVKDGLGNTSHNVEMIRDVARISALLGGLTRAVDIPLPADA